MQFLAFQHYKHLKKMVTPRKLQQHLKNAIKMLRNSCEFIFFQVFTKPIGINEESD